MEGSHNGEFRSDEFDASLNTDKLLDEIEELENKLRFPLSLNFSQSFIMRSLAANSWHLRTSKKSVFANDTASPAVSAFENEKAMESQRRLIQQMRVKAVKKLKRVSMKERTRLLGTVCKFSFEELLRQHIRARRNPGEVDTDSTAEMEEEQSEDEGTGTVTPTTATTTTAEEDATASAARPRRAEVEDVEEEDEEDDLMRLVRKQREAYSARVAAGRPSIRRRQPQPTKGAPNAASASEAGAAVVTTPIAKSAMSKQARAYRAWVRKHIGKAARLRANVRREKIAAARKAAKECAKFIKQSLKGVKSPLYRARRLLREVTAYWCAQGGGGGSRKSAASAAAGASGAATSSDTGGAGGGEGSAAAVVVESAAASRRRAEKLAAEQRRADLELLEARRQQRKLNFLLTQTELYAHFMAKTLSRAGGGKEGAAPASSSVDAILGRLQDAPKQLSEGEEGESSSNTATSSIAEAAKAAAGRLGINVDDEFDPEKLKAQALSRVQMAIERENQKRAEFQNPQQKQQSQSTEAVELDVSKPPELFKGDLKTYQLKGLAWLLTLFDQGINGILADEMGLGKTVQTIAFLGALAERYNLWGPFLIVTPASTLHNWTQELTKFAPDLRLVPYWGSPSERKILRRFWSSGGGGALLGTRAAPFHVVVTSYQVVLQDAKFINRTAWTYIVLDEAHAIKSTTSQRWRLLLSFKCRNRLLLTGTPIQNAMRELWALLHFIMPALFDSHDEFAAWFSKDIESQAASSGAAAAADKPAGSGAMTTLNENQLSRLRLILKPFMLRRVKTEVEHEITEKTEVLIYCPLTVRQSVLYERLKRKIHFEDLNDDDSSSSFSLKQPDCNRLMNLVMQLRKVCNHPDLFDRRDTRFSATSVRPHPRGLWWVPRLLFEAGLVAGETWRCLATRRLDLSQPRAEVVLRHDLQVPLPSLPALVTRSFQYHHHRDIVLPPVFDIDASGWRFVMEVEGRIGERCVSSQRSLPDFIYSAFTLPACVPPVRLYCPRPYALETGRTAIGKWASGVPQPPSMCLVSPGYLIADSGKLKELDRLLARLKPEGHRVLIYSQMTRMIDLLEELMQYRNYSYLRLDGSSRLCDRRDMVAQWQAPHAKWFVFLLSTRAGGLGINLTAADTVIFYDSDWNPTVDQQAMDRAHRLGQLKPITVYRLIAKSTVEGRMLQRAEEKRAMQRMVISGDAAAASFVQMDPAGDQNRMTQSEMVSLLLDDEELAKRLAQRRRNQPQRGRPPANKKAVQTDAGGTAKPVFSKPSADSILSRKRQAAWAERNKGRAKKPKVSQQPPTS